MVERQAGVEQTEERYLKMEAALNKCWKVSEHYREDGRAVSELKQIFRDLGKELNEINKRGKDEGTAECADNIV